MHMHVYGTCVHAHLSVSVEGGMRTFSATDAIEYMGKEIARPASLRSKIVTRVKIYAKLFQRLFNKNFHWYKDF